MGLEQKNNNRTINKATMENIKLFGLTRGCFDMDFYEQFIKHNLTKKQQKLLKEAINDDGFAEYERIAFKSNTDRVVEFTTIFIIDIAGSSVPIICDGVNTSSCLAMCLCGTDCEGGDESDEENELYCAKEIGDMCDKRVSETITNYIIENATEYYESIKTSRKNKKD